MASAPCFFNTTLFIMEGAYLNHYDTLIIVSSDGDFESSVRKVRDIGKRVEVLYFKNHFSQSLNYLAILQSEDKVKTEPEQYEDGVIVENLWVDLEEGFKLLTFENQKEIHNKIRELNITH